MFPRSHNVAMSISGRPGRSRVAPAATRASLLSENIRLAIQRPHVVLRAEVAQLLDCLILWVIEELFRPVFRQVLTNDHPLLAPTERRIGKLDRYLFRDLAHADQLAAEFVLHDRAGDTQVFPINLLVPEIEHIKCEVQHSRILPVYDLMLSNSFCAAPRISTYEERSLSSRRRALVLHIHDVGIHEFIQAVPAIRAADSRLAPTRMKALQRLEILPIDVGLAKSQFVARSHRGIEVAGVDRR